MLWASGCSHTYGDDLEDRSNAWPAVLARKLDMTYINNGVPGGSNERIMYEAIKEPEHEIKIIAWTYSLRITRYNSQNHQINFNPSSNNTYSKMHYADWSNSLFNTKLWLQQIILLQRYFDSTDQAYVMIDAAYNYLDKFTSDEIIDHICFDLMTDEMIDNEKAEIQQYINAIDKSYYYGFNDFRMTSLRHRFPTGASGHLLESGHNDIAERIYNFICSNSII